ncbi:hypothetical protein CISIN_1g0362901mg, partial [Citrus sinensis]
RKRQREGNLLDHEGVCNVNDGIKTVDLKLELKLEF